MNVPTPILIVLLLAEILSGRSGNVVTLIRFSLSNENKDLNCYLTKSDLKAKTFQAHVTKVRYQSNSC